MALRLALGVVSLAASLALAPNALAAPAQGGVWCAELEGEALPFDGSAGEGWGTAVAVTETHLLLGAQRTAQLGNSTGIAYVFTRHEGQWVFQASLRPPVSHISQRFGSSVALSGDTAFVGAAGDITSTGGQYRAGAVYVFERRGAKWVYLQRLGPAVFAQVAFGNSIAVNGDRAIVGSVNDPWNGSESGAAYVYERSPQGIWSQAAYLVGNDTGAGDSFGAAVDIEGDLAVVGAAQGFPSKRGAVYAFVRRAGAWQQEVKLSPGLQFADSFGIALALSEGWLLVGDPIHPDPNGVPSAMGAVYAFQRRAGTWTQRALLQPLGFDGARFGTAVDLQGKTAAIGAPLAQTPRVYAFERSGGAWSETMHWSGPVGSKLGTAIGLAGDRIAAGAPALTRQGTPVGGARTFLRVDAVGTYCTAKVDSVGCAPSMGLVGEPSVLGTGALVVRAGGVQSGRTGLMVYGLNGRAALPFQGGTLCVEAPRVRTPLSNSGGNPPGADCSGSLAFDFRGLIGADAATFAPGTTVNAQAWYRDPGGVLPYGLSDAVEFGLCP